jgi:hypothetical protein
VPSGLVDRAHAIACAPDTLSRSPARRRGFTALPVAALIADGALSLDTRADPPSDVPTEQLRYGLGFWLHSNGPAVLLEGCDQGLSFRSCTIPRPR